MFTEFPKMQRLRREVVITEKIDGTNAAITISPVPDVESPVFFGGRNLDTGELYNLRWGYWDGEDRPTSAWAIFAQSRTRAITVKDDNYGFAAWVYKNASSLVATLGKGTHYGEWWGQGIQRKYGMSEKRFSLFQSERWKHIDGTQVPGLHVVPQLASGILSDDLVDSTLDGLRLLGSVAAPGYMDPEGIVIYHTKARENFKVTLKNDEVSKGEAAQTARNRMVADVAKVDYDTATRLGLDCS
jgi:hypothetical protein